MSGPPEPATPPLTPALSAEGAGRLTAGVADAPVGAFGLIAERGGDADVLPFANGGARCPVLSIGEVPVGWGPTGAAPEVAGRDETGSAGDGEGATSRGPPPSAMIVGGGVVESGSSDEAWLGAERPPRLRELTP